MGFIKKIQTTLNHAATDAAKLNKVIENSASSKVNGALNGIDNKLTEIELNLDAKINNPNQELFKYDKVTGEKVFKQISGDRTILTTVNKQGKTIATRTSIDNHDGTTTEIFSDSSGITETVWIKSGQPLSQVWKDKNGNIIQNGDTQKSITDKYGYVQNQDTIMDENGHLKAGNIELVKEDQIKGTRTFKRNNGKHDSYFTVDKKGKVIQGSTVIDMPDGSSHQISEDSRGLIIDTHWDKDSKAISQNVTKIDK